MDTAAGEVPDQPGVNGTEEQFALLGTLTGAGDIVQQPLDLGAGEVSVGNQTGLLADGIAIATGNQIVDDIGGTAALPDNGVVDGFAGCLIPDDGGFTLVGDADTGNVICFHTQLFHSVLGNFQGGAPDFHSIVLDPAGLREDLTEFSLCGGADIACMIKQNAAGTGSTLIQGHDIFHGVVSL